MRTQLKPRWISEVEWAGTIFGLAILFGVFVRILPLLLTDFPINDGGMFSVMMRDLRENSFVLPVFTTYNFTDIPYAYPPLGFYIGALFELIGFTAVDVLRWLPAVFTVGTIPLYYLLARELMGDRPRAALATAFFALAAGNYVWLLMGGGLTRALGAVFYVLAIYHTHRTLLSPNWRSTILSTIFCSLVVLSHPQYAFLAFMGCAIFWVFLRSRTSLVHILVILSGSLLLTSPWWGLVVYRHGIDVFLSAGRSSDFGFFLTDLWKNLLLRQTIIPFAMILRWLGLGWVVYKRRFDLLAWGFLPFFIDQRSAPIVTAFAFPILAAFGFMDVLPALLGWVRTRKWQTVPDAAILNHHGLSMSLLGILFYLFIECCAHAFVIRNMVLPEPSREVMAWVRSNTDADSTFMILTGREDVMTDPVQEWFPALAERHSVTTLQGLEWTLQEEFNTRYRELYALQGCRDINCAAAWDDKTRTSFAYLIMDKDFIDAADADPLLQNDYRVVFENERYEILEK